MAKHKIKSKIKTKSKAKRLKISACYIVKNSADDLKTSIESLKHAVDEIVVVDTGSTDSTVEVAKSFGAKIFYREWDDDFSAPRNLALEKASGDWIIFLDSDEYFSEKTKKNIRFAIEKAGEFGAEVLLLNRFNLDYDENGKQKILTTDYSTRVLKKQPGLHYVGKIHEQPMVGDRDIIMKFPVTANNLTVYHTGYVGPLGKAKSERNLKLLLEELETTDNPKRIWHYVAACNLDLGNLETAEEFARLDLKTGKRDDNMAEDSYRIMLDILRTQSRFDEFEEFVKAAEKDFPNMPEFTAELAICYARKKDYKKAVETMKTAIKKFKNYDHTAISSTLFNEELLKKAEGHIKFWSEQIKISACYIVKNSAEDLKISLKSLCEYVDEIIVVDTGSTDSTVEVAKSFGAKVFHREWDDDFSAPRNLALEKASGDWIIFLDSDEYFADGSGKNIHSVVKHVDESKKTGLLVHLINIDKNSGNKILDRNFVMRAFKNQKDLHYVGKIHEEVRVGENPLTEVTFAPPELLTIFHTGYSSEFTKSKAERNLKLLLEELAETNEPQRIYGYIAECYNGLDDFENAEKFARFDIASRGEQKNFSTRSFRIMLSILADEPERFAERERFAAFAVKIFPALPEFTAELAECFARRENFSWAVETMNLALEKYKNYKEFEPTQFNDEMAKFAESRIISWSEKINRR